MVKKWDRNEYLFGKGVKDTIVLPDMTFTEDDYIDYIFS